MVISAIDGMGGIGKTALALHAAHRLAGRYPDGHLFINLAGFTAGRQALAALTASDPEQAGELLEQLADCSLLEAASPDRYRMHDLLRAHARTLAGTDPGSGEAARARLYHYYQHTARHPHHTDPATRPGRPRACACPAAAGRRNRVGLAAR